MLNVEWDSLIFYDYYRGFIKIFLNIYFIIDKRTNNRIHIQKKRVSKLFLFHFATSAIFFKLQYTSLETLFHDDERVSRTIFKFYY